NGITNLSQKKRPASNIRHFFRNPNSNVQITLFKDSNFHSIDATYFPPDLNNITNLISQKKLTSIYNLLKGKTVYYIIYR
ncbi:MAG: hypothetical protein ACKPKO_52075, partial [Candidatus Fonsibacter sp.]